MSLQRIIETARKTGLPVIVTDVAGREPMVILPLEQFESLVESVDKIPARPESKPISVAPIVKNETDTLKDRISVLPEKAVEHAQDDQESSLEERFYLDQT